ncbi:Disease resistance protein RPP13 [Rhynchospora pubera]|uniref:Disease resistance protein RPP13 n=1 Tax=Rhynchospora pubera TaxID=906938 RepID=A0AAV8CSU2_9POAL|nr:Disease resistance protein RPP13 [Rhynchospora pubera]
MEGAAIKFALGKLNVLLNMGLKMGLELYNVSDEVTHIQLALRMIQCFLQDAHSKRNTNSAAKQWVNEVRDVAYRIEDAVDTFLVDIEDNRARNSGVWGKLARLKKPLKVKELVDEIKTIRSTLETISQLRIQLGITDASASSPQFDEELFRPARPLEVDDSEVIGLDRDKNEIITQLLDTNISRRAVLSIVGMGGLGKTTLAQKVYKSNELETHFTCRVWLSISQKFDVHNLLREILHSVEPNLRNENPTIRQEDLRTKLRESLTQKRYLIVLDDVWSIGLWESLRTTLPDEKNASRVLITTRIVDVARAADGNSTPHELRHLNENESLTLLFQKANIPIGESGVQFRTDLNDVARQLTKMCAYLPLALIVLGSILSRRERTKNAWQRVHETFDWHDEATKRCSEVLLLSYVELPYHLKPCFLYFASFPEDYEISAKHVIRMWIAEGFIPRGGHGTMEEKAQNFLEELLRRSLVQVIKKSWDGKCKTCRVHDLVREMAIQEAREENFFTVFTKEDDEIQFSAQKNFIHGKTIAVILYGKFQA